jgi:predicted nuclease with TOPRIM domain
MPEDNELNPIESIAQNSPQDEISESEALQMRLAELESLITRKDRELTARDNRISELEETVTGLESEIISLKQAVAEANDNLSKLNDSLVQAIASYRELVIQANSDVPEELVSGDSIEAINNSLVSAKELVSKVRKGVEAEISLVRVPTGAPQRTTPDLSALSPREKIQYAVGGFSS